VGGRVDPERHPAHDCDPGASESPAQRPGDLETVGGTPPRPDDRHGVARGEVEKAVEPARDMEHGGRARQRNQPSGVVRVASADQLDAHGGRPRPGVREVELLQLAPNRLPLLAPDGRDQLGVAQPEHELDPAAGELEVPCQPRDQPRARYAAITRTRARLAATRVAVHAASASSAPPR
jgi:hypothetical protein